MEAGNSMAGGTIPGTMGAGLLGLEMPLHTQPQQQQHPSPFRTQQAPQAGQQQLLRNAYASYGSRVKQRVSLSPEEDPGFGGDDAGGSGADGPKRGPQTTPSPPWQRMKWTDAMVRLLIMVVYCVGDDGGGDHQPGLGKGNNNKKAGNAQQQQQQQQRKGKWKSVSRAMMERGYYVSPQQCEDKFNDLNKRYKRVNELLGRGTACRVVENQSLLDAMDHLSPKAKDEARKLLNSKHLFFREMCAYHNTAPSASASASASHLPPQPPAPLNPLPDQQQCLHHPPVPGWGAVAEEQDRPDHNEDTEHDEDEDEDDDDYVDDEEEEEDEDGNDEANDRGNKHGRCHQQNHHDQRRPHGHEDEDGKVFMAATNTWSGPKRQRRESLPCSASPPLSLSLSSSAPPSTSMQQLRCELMGMMAAGGGEQRRREWLRRRAEELEEQQVGYQSRALELERQRLKWLRFSSSKEREMERTRLENERLRLDNERMLLLLRQKVRELDSSGRDGEGEDEGEGEGASDLRLGEEGAVRLVP